MRKYLAGIAIATTAAAVMATDARIETMGGQQHFFKDDQSIYFNPATIAGYDKMLIGSFGIYNEDLSDSTKDANNQQYNTDAAKPHFGGTVSFGATEEKKSKFSIGAVFNRYDPILRYVTSDDIHYIGDPKNANEAVFIDTVAGKIDVITGYTFNSGFTVGIGAYAAFQSQKEDNVDVAQTSAIKGTFGVSGPVADGIELEASVGVTALTLKGYEENNPNVKVSSADNDIALSIDVRAFTDMSKINGSFVPHIQANIINHHGDERLLEFNGGIGFNSFIDRGFFYGSFEGIYEDDSRAIFSNYTSVTDGEKFASTGTRNRIGGRVAIGIERNVLTDWLVWRVGAQKLVAYEKLAEGEVASYWVENSEDDHVSFGMGVNIENRLKVDAVVAEDLIYTFSNLFSGNSHHFSTKISATFSF